MNEHDNDNIENLHPAEDFISSANTIRTDKDIVIKDLFIINNTDLITKRGRIINRRVYNSNSTNSSIYSLSTTDYLLGVTSLISAPTIGLPRPSLVGNGKQYIIKDEVGGAATTTITVVSAGEKTIDGSSSTTLTTNYQSKSFYSDGANWFTY